MTLTRKQARLIPFSIWDDAPLKIQDATFEVVDQIWVEGYVDSWGEYVIPHWEDD